MASYVSIQRPTDSDLIRHEDDGTAIPNVEANWGDFDLFFDEQGGPGLFTTGHIRNEPSQPLDTHIAQSFPSERQKDQGSRFGPLGNDRRNYDKYPQLYFPDEKGNPLRTSVICDFLKSQETWDKIKGLEESINKKVASPIPTIAEPLRDAIMATVHVVLAKVLRQEKMGRIPATFPPLQTVQTVFGAYFCRLADFYPILHSSVLEIDSRSQYNGAGRQLQLLSIFVSGALLIPVPQVQTFSIDLASIILQVLYDICLRDANQTRDIWLATSSVLITVFGIWSGNKRQMELAEALRGSYTTVSV
jgi:hypothetical protein